MKKKVLLLLLVMAVLAAPLFSAGVRELKEFESIVKVESVENNANGISNIYAYRTDGSSVIYHVSSDTIFEGISLKNIEKDDILVIESNGIATMSIPPQMTALRVRDVTLAASLGYYNADFAEPIVYAPIEERASELSLPFDINDMIDRFSYSYGYLSMDNLIAQNLIVRGDYFARGIIDAIDLRQDLLLNFDEMIMVTQEYFDTVFSAGITGDYGNIVTNLSAIEALSAPDNLEDEFAYAYGYILAYQILTQGIEIDRVAFPYGMLNRLYNAEALLTIEEMNSSIDAYVQYINQVVQEWYNQVSSENLAKAEAFLAENATKEGVVAISDELQIEYVSRAEGDAATPTEDDTVVVNYTLRDLDGNVIEENEGASFPLSGVIEGFRTAILNMNVGDSITAYIHPSIGYGEYGTGTIEPNELLVFDIELVSIENTADQQ